MEKFRPLPAGDIWCFPACRCSRPCYQTAEVAIQTCCSHADYELLTPSLYDSLPVTCNLPVSFLLLPATCLSVTTPVHFSTCLFLSSFPLDSSFYSRLSLFVCSCLSSVPVRWNIGALLMIQQPFLYLSIHLLLIVKLLSTTASCQAWSPFNIKAGGQLRSLTGSPPLTCCIHYLHCSNHKTDNLSWFQVSESLQMKWITEVSGMKWEVKPTSSEFYVCHAVYYHTNMIQWWDFQGKIDTNYWLILYLTGPQLPNNFLIIYWKFPRKKCN